MNEHPADQGDEQEAENPFHRPNAVAAGMLWRWIVEDMEKENAEQLEAQQQAQNEPDKET